MAHPFSLAPTGQARVEGLDLSPVSHAKEVVLAEHPSLEEGGPPFYQGVAEPPTAGEEVRLWLVGEESPSDVAAAGA